MICSVFCEETGVMLKLHNARFAVSVVLQVELHVDELLISAYTRIEAFRVSPVFNEAHFL